jgi:hypothetical protein
VTAPRPPIGFRFDVPDHWTVLDLGTATSDDWIERFLDERTATVPGAAAQRPRTRQVLRQMIDQHQRAGVLFAAFRPAGPAAGAESAVWADLEAAFETPSALATPATDSLVAAGLALAWQELSNPDLDALERFCRQDDPGPGEHLAAREVCRVRLRHGDGVRVRSRQLAPAPLSTTHRPVAIVQHLIPVPGTGWLGVFSLTTPDVERADGYAELADRVAASLELLDDSGQPLPSYWM